ncbi:MAG TPA: ABC transporter ATP-binding protein [Candidatus Paceibacterota bacterium]
MKEVLLKLEDIKVTYGGIHALDGVDVAIDEGEVVALMGPNGAGKSTVLKALFGITPISHGQVLWQEQKVSPKPHEMVKRGISFVPQGRQIFGSLSVYENLQMGGFSLSDTSDLGSRIDEVLRFFPMLKEKRKARANTLSGGQQQMLAIARGLVTDPKLLLLDEPTLGLAPKIVKEVFEKIKEINRERKIAILVVEHNIVSLLEVVHRGYVLDHGKIIKHGSSQELKSSGILDKIFVGAHT